MGQILVRNLDDAVISRLKTKAELAGQSLEQTVRDLLTEKAPLTPQERVAMIDRLRMKPKDGEVFPAITKEDIREGLLD